MDLYQKMTSGQLLTLQVRHNKTTIEDIDLLFLQFKLILGRVCTDSELESMLAEAPGPINFTMFLTIIGDRVAGTHKD